MSLRKLPLPWGWLALVMGSVLVYFFGLDSPYAPTNGDEMVYVHIARMTAESGHWLPLQSELANMRNTKPPLLFWQALVAGNWGQNWSLFALRLPSVLYTLAVATFVGIFTFLMARRAPATGLAESAVDAAALRSACIAMALFLLFFSSFRYSRVYVTSAPETFWLSLPMWWVLWLVLRPHVVGSQTAASSDRGLGDTGLRSVSPARFAGSSFTYAQPGVAQAPGVLAYLSFGVAIGLGAAYKSFALLAPAAAALWCALLLVQPGLQWRSVVRTTAGVALSTLVGLGIFALWFVLDPNPAAVWQEFVVGENAGKLSGAQGYFHAALFGTYPVWTQLYAYPENAGTLLFLVFGFFWLLAPQAFRRATWAGLSPAQRVLLVWLVVWLLVFSLPSQRSARYLIPAMPALAIAMALVWDRLARPWFWLTLALLVPALVIMARVAGSLGPMGIADGWQVATAVGVASVGIGFALTGLLFRQRLRAAALVCTLALYATFGFMVAPLSAPEAQFSAAVQARMRDRHIAVPNGFTGQFERYRFLLPDAKLIPYDTDGRNTGERYPDMQPAPRLERLLNEFDAVIWIQEQLEDEQPSCVPGCTVLATRWHVKGRHKSGEVTLDNLWYPQQWLFRKEWLVVRAAP